VSECAFARPARNAAFTSRLLQPPAAVATLEPARSARAPSVPRAWHGCGRGPRRAARDAPVQRPRFVGPTSRPPNDTPSTSQTPSPHHLLHRAAARQQPPTRTRTQNSTHARDVPRKPSRTARTRNVNLSRTHPPTPTPTDTFHAASVAASPTPLAVDGLGGQLVAAAFCLGWRAARTSWAKSRTQARCALWLCTGMPSCASKPQSSPRVDVWRGWLTAPPATERFQGCLHSCRARGRTPLRTCTLRERQTLAQARARQVAALPWL